MNRNARLAWTGCVVIAMAALLIVGLLGWQTRTYRSALAAITAKQAALENRLQQMHAAARLPKSVPLPATLAATNDTAAITEAEWLQARAAQRRSMILAWTRHAYAPCFRSTLLSPAQLAAFENVVTAHWVRWSDAADVFFEQHLAPNDPVVQSMGKEEWSRFTNEERQALGEAAFEQLQSFERQAAVTSATDAVAGLVFDTGEPLTPDRATALNQGLAANSAKYQKGGRASLDDIDQAAVVRQLESVLTPRQLEALRMSLAARKFGPEIGRLLQEAAKQEAPRR